MKICQCQDPSREWHTEEQEWRDDLVVAGASLPSSSSSILPALHVDYQRPPRGPSLSPSEVARSILLLIIPRMHAEDLRVDEHVFLHQGLRKGAQSYGIPSQT